MPKGKQGGFAGAIAILFTFMILSFVIVFISVAFIYMGGVIEEEMHTSLDNKTEEGDTFNWSESIDEHIGAVNKAYYSLTWISVFLIIGMVMGIITASFLSTIRPVYFVPYIFILITAIITGAILSNAYDTLRLTDPINSTFELFVGANFIMLHLPVWMAILGGLSGIIMTVRLIGQRQERDMYGY